MLLYDACPIIISTVNDKQAFVFCFFSLLSCKVEGTAGLYKDLFLDLIRLLHRTNHLGDMFNVWNLGLSEPQTLKILRVTLNDLPCVAGTIGPSSIMSSILEMVSSSRS